MVKRSTLLMLAGALAGIMTWVIMEPSAPSAGDIARWSRWEGTLGLLLGVLLGLALGGLSGFFQGSRVHLLRGLVIGAVLGGIGGSLGISLGGAIYNELQKTSFGEAGRIMGFTLFGAFIGVAQGLAGLSLQRAVYGFIGGLIGGALGGVAFVVIGTISSPAVVAVDPGANETGSFSRLVSFAVICMAVGLLVGIAQGLSRQAWVRLELGRNEGKEWPIDVPSFVIGRAETAQVPLFGDATVLPNHAMIHRHQGRYVLTALDPVPALDVNGVPTKQTLLTSGDRFKVGTHTLHFFERGKVVQRIPETRQYAVAGAAPNSVPTQANAPAFAPVQMTAQPTTQTLSLVATSGPLIGQRFPVLGPITLGRENPAVPLAFDSLVSRTHAQITPEADGIAVQDMNSTNGTYFQGTKSIRFTVRRGESFTIGSTTFQVE